MRHPHPRRRRGWRVCRGGIRNGARGASRLPCCRPHPALLSDLALPLSSRVRTSSRSMRSSVSFVNFQIVEVCRILVSERAIVMPDLVGPARSDRNFYAFRSFRDEPAKLAVKTIQSPEIVEGDTSAEAVIVTRFGERTAISGKPVVVEVRQAVLSKCFVQDGQSSALKKLDLLLIGQCRLLKTHAKTRKNPPI
jgi:hypothetical protein